MLPTTYADTSKDKKTYRQHSTEDGYHSLPGSPWTPIGATHHFGNATMPSPGADFLPPLNSSFINRDTTNTLDGRGILIERIKVAQHTIDSLSAKVFFFENERTLLKEKKKQFETGYFKLVEENSKLLNEKIYKDTLLKKLNLMQEEVDKLLKKQEHLQENYNEQLHVIDKYKRDKTNLEDEVEALKKVNQEIHLSATKESASSERLRSSEEELKNRCIVLRIEKETLGSEVERLIGKLKNQDEKLRSRKEKEQDLIKENSILRQEIRVKDRELRDTTENGIYLQDQLQMVVDEKNDFANQSKHGSFLVHEELRELHGKLDASQKCLFDEKKELENIRNERDSFEIHIEKLKSKLLDSENQEKTFRGTIQKLEKQTQNDRFKILNFEKETSSLKQRIRNLKQDNTSLSDNIKSIESRMKEELSSKKVEYERLSLESKQIQEELQRKTDQLETDHVGYVAESRAVKKALEDQSSHLQNELETVTHHFMEYKREQETCLTFNQTEVQDLKKQNTNVSKRLSSSEAQLEKLTLNFDECSKELQCTRKENESLQIEVDERDKVVEQFKTRIKKLEKEANELNEKHTNNMTLIDQLNQQSKAELASQKSIYDDKLKLLKTDYELLKTSLRNCEQEKSICIETYKKQIKSLQTQSDGDVEKLAHERDELSTSLQSAHLDLNEYKVKFNSLEKELEEVCMVNADLKQNLSLLSKELETYQVENQNSLDKDDEIGELRQIILNLRKREEEMARTISKSKTEKTCFDGELTVLKQENDSLKAGQKDIQQQWEKDRKEFLEKIDMTTKQQNDLQLRNDKLKAECRKRAMQSHAKCGELEMFKTDLYSMKKELDVVVELNKKLEQVNETLQDENKTLTQDVVQHQHDIGVLKTSYEDLLAKELSKQKSEFILKENQLLKRISNGANVLNPLHQNGMTSF